MTESVNPQGAILQRLNAVLYADLRQEDEFDRVKPFLAHYTSLEEQRDLVFQSAADE